MVYGPIDLQHMRAISRLAGQAHTMEEVLLTSVVKRSFLPVRFLPPSIPTETMQQQPLLPLPKRRPLRVHPYLVASARGKLVVVYLDRPCPLQRNLRLSHLLLALFPTHFLGGSQARTPQEALPDPLAKKHRIPMASEAQNSSEATRIQPVIRAYSDRLLRPQRSLSFPNSFLLRQWMSRR